MGWTSGARAGATVVARGTTGVVPGGGDSGTTSTGATEILTTFGSSACQGRQALIVANTSEVGCVSLPTSVIDWPMQPEATATMRQAAGFRTISIISSVPLQPAHSSGRSASWMQARLMANVVVTWLFQTLADGHPPSSRLRTRHDLRRHGRSTHGLGHNRSSPYRRLAGPC